MTVGHFFSYQITNTVIVDPNGDVLTYSATISGDLELPKWLHVSTSNRTLIGFPTITEVLNIKVLATDPYMSSAFIEFTLNISNQNPLMI